MIKYKDIVYSKKAPKEHNVLWIKAGKYNENYYINPEEDTDDYPGSKIYQFVDGNWRSINNADITSDYISGMKEDINSLQSDVANNKEDLEESITNVNNSVTALSKDVVSYKGVESSIAMPIINIAGLHTLSMDTTSITVDTSIIPAVDTNSKNDAIGRAIYYQHVPYIIITNTLSGNTQIGVPCKLDFTSTNFAFKTNYSTELRPTYITETTINISSNSAEPIQKKIKVEFYSMNEIEANTGLNKVIVSLID